MANKSRYSVKHPYAAIEHRVLDSEAYADLSFSARALLFQIARQLTKDNNGRLLATHSYLSRYGFSDRTITRGIAELISHGMIYRTKSGGYQQGAALYGVTWLPVKRSEGLFLDGFNHCAWRDWIPDDGMPRGFLGVPNLRTGNRKNGGWTRPLQAKFTVGQVAKFTDTELMPCSSSDLTKEKSNSPLEKHPEKVGKVGKNEHGSLGKKIGPHKKRRTWGSPTFTSAYFERRRARGLFGAMMGTA